MSHLFLLGHPQPWPPQGYPRAGTDAPACTPFLPCPAHSTMPLSCQAQPHPSLRQNVPELRFPSSTPSQPASLPATLGGKKNQSLKLFPEASEKCLIAFRENCHPSGSFFPPCLAHTHTHTPCTPTFPSLGRNFYLATSQSNWLAARQLLSSPNTPRHHLRCWRKKEPNVWENNWAFLCVPAPSGQQMEAAQAS